MASEKPQQILQFITRFLDQHGYPPSVRQIQHGVGISSTSVVKYHLAKLKKLGYIEHDEHTSRGIRLLARKGSPASPARTRRGGGLEDWLRIPILGRIAAGDPLMPGESPLGEITLTREIVREAGDLYALEVRGDSMIDALINDGDIVVMKPTREAHNGEMVAVWLKDRQETTLKHFYLEGGRVRLQPANPRMKPIFKAPRDVEIQGKVVAVIRKLT